MSGISIHALREEGDDGIGLLGHHGGQFLSTPSARRATRDPSAFELPCQISIHALREEGDAPFPRMLDRQRISIHALREEGDVDVIIPQFVQKISIHALREEGDMPAREREVSCW